MLLVWLCAASLLSSALAGYSTSKANKIHKEDANLSGIKQFQEILLYDKATCVAYTTQPHKGMNIVKDTIHDIDRMSKMMSSVIMAYNKNELKMLSKMQRTGRLRVNRGFALTAPRHKVLNKIAANAIDVIQCALAKALPLLQSDLLSDTGGMLAGRCATLQSILPDVLNGKGSMANLDKALLTVHKAITHDTICIGRQIDKFSKRIAYVARYFNSVKSNHYSYYMIKKLLLSITFDYSDIAHDLFLLASARRKAAEKLQPSGSTTYTKKPRVKRSEGDDDDEDYEGEEDYGDVVGDDDYEGRLPLSTDYKEDEDF